MQRVLLLIALALLTTASLTAQRELLTKADALPCLNKSFAIVAHIVRDTFGNTGVTEAQVQTSIDLLNEWFDPICVEFVIASFEIIDNFQYDNPANYNEWQQMWLQYHQFNKINLYIVNSVDGLVRGKAFADRGAILDPGKSGVLLTKQAVLEDSLRLWIVHGFGRYCGLPNTNEEAGTELVDGSNCLSAGDRICDTPADPFLPGDEEGPDSSLDLERCRFISLQTDANGDFYVPQTGNVMSDFPVKCWCGLTHSQFYIMALATAVSPLDPAP